MHRYEKFLLRKYALRAFAGGSQRRVKRPLVSLAAWLFEYAAEVGVPEPNVDMDDLEVRMGRLCRDSWIAYAPAIAHLRHSARAPAPSTLERQMLWLGETLSLSRLEADILRVAARVATLEIMNDLARAMELGGGGGEVNCMILSALTGHDTRSVGRALRPQQPLRLVGLLEDRRGGDFAASKTVLRVARLDSNDPERLRTLLIGKSKKAQLAWEDFAHLGDTGALAERIVAGAFDNHAQGINLLLYGPPGTGKTEFARTLAQRLGAQPMFVGETDDEDGEPGRGERVAALAVAKSLARTAGRTLIVVDEADDIFAGVDDGDSDRRVGSKVFMNRLVEGTQAPTLWITNHADRLGPAVLRRMSLAIRFPEPGRLVRRRVIERIAARRRLRLTAAGLDALADVRAAPAVIDSAVRAAKLTGGRHEEVARAARSIVQAMNGTPTPPSLGGGMAFDPALSAADCDLAALAERVAASGQSALSFCLHGISGAGKSAYARHLAERMGIDVIEKRASDLLSMWLGESEKAIARAFEEAADTRAMLVIDEADSLLRDRAGADHSWEVTQVNEMLAWMERHPYPFACTTNLMETLDPATLRRFLFKVQFLPMTTAQAREAFRRSFGIEAPRELDDLDNLAPGDFALVARKAALTGDLSSNGWIRLLSAETEAKPERRRRKIGY
jgi:SpoVK/Ycf46/Vps4 family AAA+-type ATPase